MPVTRIHDEFSMGAKGMPQTKLVQLSFSEDDHSERNIFIIDPDKGLIYAEEVKKACLMAKGVAIATADEMPKEEKKPDGNG